MLAADNILVKFKWKPGESYKYNPEILVRLIIDLIASKYLIVLPNNDSKLF